MGRRLILPDRLERFNRWWNIPEGLVAILALVALALDIGFEEHALVGADLRLLIELSLLILLVLRVPITFMCSSTLRSGLGRCREEGSLLLLAALALLIAVTAGGGKEVARVTLQIVTTALAIIHLFRRIRNLQRLSISPLLLLAGSFMLLILIGAGLLMLPRATAPGVAMSFIDALFMSASAICVTGLSLYDIGKDFTEMGQWILLTLVQIGGLGIMTFVAFASIAFGQSMSIRDRVAMGEVLSYDVVGKVGRVVIWILGITLVCELIGAVLMYGSWVDASGMALPTADQWKYSIFHSIAAFCNAGFSLHADSLTRYHGVMPVMLPITLLILVGGIGFTVIMDLLHYRPWRLAGVRRIPVIGKYFRRHPLPRLSLQTKVVLLTTTALIVGGTAMFWLFEHQGVLAGMSASEQIESSLFHGGVTPRTAGFNAIDYSQTSPATNFLTTLLMLIGASPGSTAGGLKTTTIALLMIALWSIFRGRPVEAFRRRIPDDQVKRVLVLLVLVLIVINGAVLVLSMTETRVLEHTRGFQRMTFEVVSAFGTVGLSTGITTEFTDFGKIILTLCMFAGRVGPLTFVLAMGRKQRAAFDYPEESVMLG